MKKLICLISFVAWLAGCKPLRTAQATAGPALPPGYLSTPDTTRDSIISWRLFFRSEPLVALIDSALANNWDLKISLQQIQLAQSGVLLSKAALLPTVGAGIGASLRKFGLYTMDGAGNKTTEIHDGQLVPEHLPDYFAGLQTAWELDLWGKFRNQKKAALARWLASTEGRHLVTTTLITSIAADYYELQSLDQSIRILDETFTLQQRALDMVKVQKQAGIANELAVKQFEAQLKAVNTRRFVIQEQIATTENHLNLLTGRYPQPVLRDTAHFNNDTPAILRTGIPAQLLLNRPDIRQAALVSQATRADLATARAAFYPSLTIAGSLGLQAFKTPLLWQTPASIAYGLLANLTAPLVNRKVIQANFGTARALQTQALYDYQKTIATAYVEVYNALQRFSYLSQAFHAQQDRMTSLEQAIHIAQQLFKTGRASYLEVLIAQQIALDARLELVETKKNQWLTCLSLYKALGGGWR